MKIIKSLYSFVDNYIKFKSKKDNRFDLSVKDIKPMLFEVTKNTGFDRHYVYHPAWAARIVAFNKPEKHIDISSTLSFCSINAQVESS